MTRKLGERLVSDGVLLPEMLTRALERQKETGQKLGEVLVRLGLDETPVLRMLAQELNTRFVSTEKLAQARVEVDLLERVPVRLAEGFDFVPLRLTPTGVLYIAIAEPQRQRVIDEIARTVGATQVLPLIAVRRSIRAAIRRHYYADAHAFEHMPEDDACPHCGAPTAIGDFQCARCELLLVRDAEDLPPRDNVSLVRALLSGPDRNPRPDAPSPPHHDKTQVAPYTREALSPTLMPVIVGGLELIETPLHPFEAYVLSFVDGQTSLADIALITSMAEVELRAIFESLSERGITLLSSGNGKPPAPVARTPASMPAPARTPTPPPMEPVTVRPPMPAKTPPPVPPAAPKPRAPMEDPTESLLQRVVQLEKAQRTAEAIEMLEKGIALLSKPAPLYNRLGMILLNHRRDYDRSAALFQKAADLEPDNSIYTMNLYSVMCLTAEATNPGKKPRR